MEILAFDQYRKIKQKSAGITAGIGIVLVLISLLWTFVETADPPLFEVLSEGSGGVDFGNWVEGSGNINNFEDPSPHAGEGKAKVIQNTQMASSDEKTTLSGEAEESEVTAPPVKETKDKDKKNTQNQDKPKEIVKNDNSPVNLNNNNSYQTGGSNHGNSDQIGNRGRDDVKILDNDGLYAFGSGEEGLQGRKPISLPKPVYEVEAEAKITYEFTIAPNGTVKNVKALTLSSNSELKNAGIKAIYKWKFEPIEQDKIQKTKVTITFKLK